MSESSFLGPNPKEYWRNKPVNERELWKLNFFIEHSDVKRLWSDFCEKLEHCVRKNSYACMLILGETGAGKTALVNRMRAYANNRFQRLDEEKTICPVVQFSIPDPCTPLEVCVAILAALGERNPRQRKSKTETIHAASMLLKTCEVKCILIDNFHDIPARRARRGIELVGARLRELIDASSALWVFLGTDEAKKVIDSEPQMIKRIPYRGYLNYFSISRMEDQINFLRVLREIDKWIPLAVPSCIADPGYSAKMFLATNGVFDRLLELVDRAWYECVAKGRERLEILDLKEAFRFVYGPGSDNFNPFTDDFVPRQLTGPGEPFEVLSRTSRK